VLRRLYRRLDGNRTANADATEVDANMLQALCDDPSTPKALALLQSLEGASLLASGTIFRTAHVFT